jgi:Fungal specific transcription factor domain
MTRTVEQLQLSKEEEDESANEDEGQNHDISSVEFLIRKMAFLEPPKDWAQREERRRIFWNVFLMDRFCSIATGWDPSLPSANINRRLPCHGPLWQKEIPLETPTAYFGVTNTSPQDSLLQNVISDAQNEQHQPQIAGFAYRIEATENLSLVTRFFLKHPVNVSNRRDLQIWMMRFKELDLRLVQ